MDKLKIKQEMEKYPELLAKDYYFSKTYKCIMLKSFNEMALAQTLQGMCNNRRDLLKSIDKYESLKLNIKDLIGDLKEFETNPELYDDGIPIIQKVIYELQTMMLEQL